MHTDMERHPALKEKQKAAESVYIINLIRDGKSKLCVFKPGIHMPKFKNETHGTIKTGDFWACVR